MVDVCGEVEASDGDGLAVLDLLDVCGDEVFDGDGLLLLD